MISRGETYEILSWTALTRIQNNFFFFNIIVSCTPNPPILPVSRFYTYSSPAFRLEILRSLLATSSLFNGWCPPHHVGCSRGLFSSDFFLHYHELKWIFWLRRGVTCPLFLEVSILVLLSYLRSVHRFPRLLFTARRAFDCFPNKYNFFITYNLHYCVRTPPR